MTDPHNIEPLANAALARALMGRNPDWTHTTVHAEQTRLFAHAGQSTARAKRPDILFDPPNCQPVVVETEFAPAHTVEQDATSRLGLRLDRTGEPIEGVLSVVLPESLKTGDLEKVNTATFRFATHYLDAKEQNLRWPTGGEWIVGGIDDLANAIEYLALSERQLARGTATLEDAVRQAAGLLAAYGGDGALAQIAEDLHQEKGEQTERMAAAILLSAFVFHATLEGHPRIPAVPLAGSIGKKCLLRTWNKILGVNYWPVFSIARKLLDDLPGRVVGRVMDRIANASSELDQLGASTYHDLTGRMFQTLIADRKFLATFYTLPPSACLLAELGVGRLKVDWSDQNAVQALRIADFACGTGALLSAAQRSVYRRYRRAGYDDQDLHRALMEHVLTGLDVMPAATHLTCSMLSAAHPRAQYGQTNIHTVPYGRFGNRTHIGALDLLTGIHSYSLFATGESLGARELDQQQMHRVKVEDKAYDLVIMNPPFTRPTNHEGARASVPVPSFAGFNTPEAEQHAMAHALKKATAIFGNGNAGLASNFMDLAHYKLKDGGVLAIVLPFSFVKGRSWKSARDALKAHYRDIHVLSIASPGLKERAFSADTEMAECLVVATKGSTSDAYTYFSNLRTRPRNLLDASITARNGTAKGIQGDIVTAPRAGICARSVMNAAQELQRGRLLLPQHSQEVNLPLVALRTLAARGLGHRDINGKPPSDTAPPRGPYDIRLIREGEIPDYPVLWRHDADRERSLIVLPDRCGEVREKCEARAVKAWKRTASCLHANLDFQLNSQSLAMCLTPEKCIGGRAWPNVIPHVPEHEIPLLLWSNSTLGLVLFWWHGTRQQKGRACLTITTLPDLPVLAPSNLTAQQLGRCRKIFDRFKSQQFLPANEAYRDNPRKALDRELLFGSASVLQLDPELEEGLDLLRKQWCAEPSVHGGKGTRPAAQPGSGPQ